MIFYFNANGNLVDMLSNEVYQGSNKVNTVYFIGPFPSTAQVTARFSLTNDEVVPALLLKVSNLSSSSLYNSAGTGLTVWEGCLDKYVTKYCGNVLVQFAITSSTDTTTTQTVSFRVRKGLPQNSNISISDEDLLDELLEKVSEIAENYEDITQSALSKVTTSTTDKQAYIKEADGTQTMMNIAVERNSSIVLRKANGNIVAGTPTENTDAVPKQYVDNLITTSTSGFSDGKKKYTLIEKIIIGYSTLLTQPADWETNYTNYYRNTGTRVNPVYVQITDSVMPAWELGVYFQYSSSGVGSVSRNYDTTGTPYNYEGILIQFEVQPYTSLFYLYVYFYETNNNSNVFYFPNFSIAASNGVRYSFNEILQYDNLYCFEFGSPTQWGFQELKSFSKSYSPRSNESIANNRKLVRFNANVIGGGSLPSNSILYVYRVDF